MSWAEIKKAVNSDLDVPLNELIERNQIIKVYGSNGQNANPYSLSVNHPGVLISFIEFVKGSSILKLDGVPFVTLNGNSNNYAWCTIMTGDSRKSFSSNNYQIVQHSYPHSINQNETNNSFPATVSAGQSVYGYYLKPIRFKTLEFTAPGGGNTYFTIEYALDV